MSARSTGRVAVTVTTPLVWSTVTVPTPSILVTSLMTSSSQRSQVMPATTKVVVPTNVRGVSLRMAVPAVPVSAVPAVAVPGECRLAGRDGEQGEDEQDTEGDRRP